MTSLRRLSYVALLVAYAQIVFGAIVRITGSGWGCGHHWPKCDGHWFPPLDGPDLIIEVFHRYLALAVIVAIGALVIAAWRRRAEPAGARVLRPALLAFGIVVATALLGMATIKLELAPLVVVAHLALAMSLLAALVVAALRAGGFGAPSATAAGGAARTWRVARIAAILAFAVLVLGALTANLGAAGACLGFPTCRIYASPNRSLLHLQLSHRVLAFLFAFHVIGAVAMLRRRGAAPVVKRAGYVALGAVVLQILVAAALVEMRLPRALQSLHQAVGTLVWIAIVVYAGLARRAAFGGEPATRPAPAPRHTPGPLEPIVHPPATQPEAAARMAQAEDIGRSYEHTLSALLAEAELRAVEEAEPLELSEPEPEPPPEPVALPPRVKTPASIVAQPEVPGTPEATTTPETPAAPPKPHSVAVIVARGADL